MPRLLDFVGKLHDRCLEAAKKLRFDKRMHVDGALMCLYATIIEHTGTLVMLADAQRRTSSMTVFRALLEAYVDFTNTFNDREYLQHLLAQNCEMWIGLLKRATEGNNRYLVDLGQAGRVPEALNNYQSELKSLIEKGKRPLKVIKRFERAGMVEEYRSVYVLASSGSHNDFAALLNRHTIMHDDDYQLSLYKPADHSSFHTVLDGAANILLVASVNIHKHLKSVCAEEFETLASEFATLRSSY